jgi:hypothetical protein
LCLQHPLELGRAFRRIAVAHRKEGIGLARQDIDVKGASEAGQGLANCGITAHDQRITPRIGADLAALGNIGFKHFCQIFGGGEAQRDHLGAGANRISAGDEVTSCAAWQWDHRIDPVSFDHGGTIRVEQIFERGQQRRTRQRGAGLDRPGAVHIGVDRVV